MYNPEFSSLIAGMRANARNLVEPFDVSMRANMDMSTLRNQALCPTPVSAQDNDQVQIDSDRSGHVETTGIFEKKVCEPASGDTTATVRGCTQELSADITNVIDLNAMD